MKPEGDHEYLKNKKGMSKIKEKKTIKNFDAVKEMRKIRDKISSEIAAMNHKQIIAYFKQRRLGKTK